MFQLNMACNKIYIGQNWFPSNRLEGQCDYDNRNPFDNQLLEKMHIFTTKTTKNCKIPP